MIESILLFLVCCSSAHGAPCPAIRKSGGRGTCPPCFMVPAPMIICLSTATPVAVSKLIWGWQVCDNTRDCKTEMAVLRTIEDIFDGSGWTDALTQADIASVVTCEGFLHASHVTKTHRAHQLLPQLYISCSRKPTWIPTRWKTVTAVTSKQMDSQSGVQRSLKCTHSSIFGRQCWTLNYLPVCEVSVSVQFWPVY